jgi:hypothetical protein
MERGDALRMPVYAVIAVVCLSAVASLAPVGVLPFSIVSLITLLMAAGLVVAFAYKLEGFT